MPKDKGTKQWDSLMTWAGEQFTNGDKFVADELAKVTRTKLRKRLLRYLETGECKKAEDWIGKKKRRRRMVNRLLRHDSPVVKAVFN